MVVNRTFIKSIYREIRGTLPRFAAIFCIAALGVGFLAGLLSTTPDMRDSADIYYDESGLMDIRLLSTMGFCEEDIQAVAGTGGIARAQGVKSSDLLVQLSDGDSVVARVHGVDMSLLEKGEGINTVELLEGRFPQSADECLVLLEKVPHESTGVGDTITFSPDNADLQDTVTQTELTITGVISTSYYMSLEREQADIGNGRLGLILYAPMELMAFDYYTDIFALVEGAAALDTFSDEYAALADGASDALENLAETQVNVRRDQIIGDAQAELDDAKAEYEREKADAEQQLDDAWQEILDARAEIATGERDLSRARRQTQDGLAQLETERENGQAELDARQAELEAGEAQYADGLAQYEAALAQLEQSRAELDAAAPLIAQIEQMIAAGMEIDEQMQAQLDGYYAGLAAYENGAAQLEQTRLTLEGTRAQLDEGAAQLAAGRESFASQIAEAERELRQAQADIAAGERELEDARVQLAEGEAEYEEGRAEAEEKLLDAEYQIRDAEQEIAQIETPKWYVLTREELVSWVSFDSNAEKVAAIAKVFPIFFFLVAALVTLTTMTRMVEEQRTQIGTLKALGYSRGTIALKYVVYAGLAGLLGCAVGLGIGLLLFPSIIWEAYSMLYTLPQLHYSFQPQYALLSAGALMACALGAAFFACISSLREQPAHLMLPKAPKAGKRVFLEHVPFVWKHLKFTQKVTVRNLVRYKKRFFMTVVGVAGCTALLLTGFGLRDSIGDIIGKQFGELWLYDATIAVRHDGDDERDFRVRAALEGEDILETLAAHTEAAHAETAGSRSETTIFVPREQETLPDFIVLRQRRGHEEIPFTASDAVVITEKLSTRLDAGAGDTITVENADGETASVTVTGVAENYVQGFVYMTADVYRAAFGKEPEYTSILARTAAGDDDARDALAERLLDVGNITGVQFNQTLQDSFSDMLKSIDAIIVVLILSAAVLAFVVLYNLTNINITERQKELATIKVLGFYRGEVASYIFRETNLLAFFGTLAGLAVGVYLHAFVVQTAEVDMVMFGRDIAPLSYVLSAALTMLFALLVNLVMRRYLNRISMVESLKAPE